MKNALLHDGLAWWAREQPDRTAIVLDHSETLSYGELACWSDGVAEHLQARGVQPGDNVAICGANCIDWVVGAFGILKAGAVIVPLNERFVRDEFAYLIDVTEPAAIIADASRKTTLEPLAAGRYLLPMETIADFRGGAHSDWKSPRVGADALAQIIFTSGTTGRPKGVMISHGQLLSKYFEMRLMNPTFGSPDVRQLMTVSLQSGVGTTWGYLFTTTNGGVFCFMRKFEAGLALRTLVEHRISCLTTFPLVLEQIAARDEFHEADLSQLSFAVTGGTRVPAEIVTIWRRKGVLLRQMYGLTEVGNYVTIASDREVLADSRSCGRAMIFTELKIVRPDGSECAANEPGEIVARGPGMMVGYWRNPEATQAMIVDGWLHTGDLGVLDDEGYLTFVDRAKDMIISSGFNVAPSEVEAVISQLPGIVEVAVIAVPDRKFGEVPAACIHVDKALDTRQVFEHCKQHLAGYKLPRYVIDHGGPLPRITNGKINKRTLRDDYANAPERFEKL